MSPATLRPGRVTGPVDGDAVDARPAVPGHDDLAPLQRVRSARRTTSRRTSLVVAALGVAVAGVFATEVLLGSFTVTVPDFLRILTGTEIPGASFIVWEDKLPRAVVGLMVGVALGAAGALFSTLLRNPLATPDVIGFSAGASAGAVTGIVVFGATGPGVSVWAFGGALATATAILLLAKGGSTAGPRLVLVGIAFAAVLQSLVSYLLVRADVFVAADAFAWLQGSLNTSTWGRARDLALALLVLLPVIALLARRLAVLGLGDDVAAGLGVAVGRSRLALVLAGVALVAVATAAAGPVAFVALLAGPISRRLLGGRTSLGAAGLVGALVVLAADFVGHWPGGPVLPVGVVTGALGAPFLLYLLVAAGRDGRGG